MAEQQPNAALDQRLDPVIVEYLESIERGESPDPKPWLERYPELADQLAAFFAAESQLDRLLTPLRNNSSLAAADADTAPAAPTGALPLRTIEDYELLSELGRGGMGVIYKARQRSLNRLVAVKMLRSAEWATPEERLRFRWEAETVATLDHPNIVPIYEVGEVPAEDGTRLPFFSMKLIEGENLSQAGGRFRNDWKGIARLLCLIARAVEHAHQRGVLHRDLKPANILLKINPNTPSSEELQRGSGFLLGSSFVTPHISDFGLARRSHHHHQKAGTLPGAIVGTPAYLAPELTRGHEFATIASDIYSLGVILYELLTGVPPFRGTTPLETIQLVAANAVTVPRKLNPAIPADLETICLKCLETDPRKRYASADELAEDLEHFLAHRPITARPIGGLTRFARWCWRQPVIAGLSAALLLVVLIGLPLIVWNWRRAVEQEQIAENRLRETQQERDRTDEAFALAHRAVADNFRLLAEDRWEEMPGSESFKKEMLGNGLKYYRAFVERHRDDPKLQREVAQAMFEIGLIATKIGTMRDAIESYQTAITLLRSLTNEHPEDVVLRRLLARSLTNLGNALNAMNRLEESLAAHEEAIAVLGQLQKDQPGDREAQKAQAEAWLNRGVLLQTSGDWQRVLESLQRGQAILNEKGLAAKDQRLTIMFLLNISQAEDRLGRSDDALRDALEAARLADLMLKASPRSEEARSMVGYAARSVGNQYRKRGDLEAAKTNFRLAQQYLDELHQQRPRMREYTTTLSLVYEDLSAIAEKQKQLPEAVKAMATAEALMKELVKRDGESHPNRESLARIESKLGRLYEALGNPDAMRKAFEQAKIHLEYLLDHNSSTPTVRDDLARVCHQLGVAFAKLKKYPEAAAAATEAAKHYRIALERSPNDKRVRKDLSSVLGNRAIAERALRRLPEALRTTEERVALWPGNALELHDAATDFTRTFELAVRASPPDAAVRDLSLKDTIQTLRQAIQAGFADRAKIRTDARFAPIRETPEFQAFLKEEEQTRP